MLAAVQSSKTPGAEDEGLGQLQFGTVSWFPLTEMLPNDIDNVVSSPTIKKNPTKEKNPSANTLADKNLLLQYVTRFTQLGMVANISTYWKFDKNFPA